MNNKQSNRIVMVIDWLMTWLFLLTWPKSMSLYPFESPSMPLMTEMHCYFHFRFVFVLLPLLQNVWYCSNYDLIAHQLWEWLHLVFDLFVGCHFQLFHLQSSVCSPYLSLQNANDTIKSNELIEYLFILLCIVFFFVYLFISGT